ncbi:hypothetical protein RSOLAG22IIIB_09977 [Rhizoctonia solani]|uniref:LYC1 C-terminal domain-containing protein n=1 Tax=Rhizoctonia solani TaxID=456999 RepID=A0A0K6G0B5_9AGAM|nr:hypothetical protein RSOLAG22IIIB_09977 [Rhizoctonia solani]
MSLEHLIIKQATDAQAHEALLHEAGFWGARFEINVNDYVKLAPIFEHGAFARDGRLTHWVLVPEGDPDSVEIYASCQVFTRDILTLQRGEISPSTSFGHLITSVVVAPEHRGKGYGKRFMSLMHSALALHRYPNPKVTTFVDRASTVTVLYSAVGDYYSRCVPSIGEPGWTLQKSFVTTWPLSRAQIPSATSSHVQLLSESDVTRTLDSDDSNIPTDLIDLQNRDPTKTYFAFVPTAPLNAYATLIGKLLLDRGDSPSNLSWGAKVPDKCDFMAWSFFGLQNLQLVVARDAKCESVEIWNVPEQLRKMARATGGETTERVDHLSAFKWYGQECDSKVDVADVVWALDER